jgi:hypothetical protein
MTNDGSQHNGFQDDDIQQNDPWYNDSLLNDTHNGIHLNDNKHNGILNSMTLNIKQIRHSLHYAELPN